MKRAPLLLLVGVGIAWGLSSRFLEREERRSSDTAADTSRYRPSVQEGLGASVAVLLDNSGSMEEAAAGDRGPAKSMVARRVIQDVLSQTEAFVAAQSGFPVNVGLYVFSGEVSRALPIGPYDKEKLAAA